MTADDDVLRQADALAGRMAEAGGPGALVASLEAGLKRQGRYIKMTGAGLVLDVALSIILAIVAFNANNTASRSESNAAAIAKVVHTQQMAVYTQCQKSLVNTTKINTLNTTLVAFLKAEPKPVTAAAQAALTMLEDAYDAALLTVPDCGSKP
jgi:hypothetical protein